MQIGAIVRRAALVAVLAAASAAVWGQDTWPVKPIKIVLPFQSGSAADRAVRIVSDKMEGTIGQSFVVENVTGVGGLIGTNRVAKESADGYTIAALNMTVLTILPHMRPKQVAFDPFNDFVPIYGFAGIPTLLGVSKDLPVDNVKALIDLAKAKPGELNYSSGGPGSPQHLAAEMFQSMTGTKLTHVPYKGATAAAADLAAGRVQVMFIAHSLALPHLPTQRIKLIAHTGLKRGAAFPDLPTLDESGVPGYDYYSWVAFYALKGTPPQAVAKLREAAAKAASDPGVGQRLAQNGLEVWVAPPEQLTKVMQADFARWQKVVQGAGLVQN